MPGQPKGKVGMHAYLTPDAHRLLFAFSEEHGVSVSAMCEVLANLMGDIADERDWDWLVLPARKVDSERRRRGGG
jgi:hypothetical protein